MAMTKKELAEVEELKKQLAIALAWRRTTKIDPDLMPPKKWGDPMSKGWNVWAYGSGWEPVRVEKWCSDTVHNGSGWEKTSSQNAIALYSTKLLALQAGRWMLEQESVEKLARVDEMIKEEILNGTN